MLFALPEIKDFLFENIVSKFKANAFGFALQNRETSFHTNYGIMLLLKIGKAKKLCLREHKNLKTATKSFFQTQ